MGDHRGTWGTTGMGDTHYMGDHRGDTHKRGDTHYRGGHRRGQNYSEGTPRHQMGTTGWDILQGADNIKETNH